MLDACESKLDIIKNFIPSWFAAVMGTGILAVDSLLYSGYLPILKDVAVALFYFNVLLFVIFLIPWVLRWIMFKDNALADLKHPVLSAFYPTIAVGCLVLGADFINIGHDMFWGEIFWTFGAVGMFLFSLIVPFYMFKSESIKLDQTNRWNIPTRINMIQLYTLRLKHIEWDYQTEQKHPNSSKSPKYLCKKHVIFY